MRCIARGLGAILCVLLVGAAQAQPQATPFLLPAESSSMIDAEALGEVWMDAAGKATIDQVAQQHAGRFQAGSPQAIYSLGEAGALWMRYRLQRAAQDTHDWLLEFPSPVLDAVTVYQRDAQGGWKAQSAGDTLAVSTWPEPGRYPHFRLDLQPGQTRDVYVRIRHITPASFPVRLATETVHSQRIQLDYLGLGATFGALVLLIAACLAQSLLYRDRIYAGYAAYASVTTLAVATYTGVASHMLWKNLGTLGDAPQASLAFIAGGSALLFVRSLSGIAARSGKLDLAVKLLGWAGFALALAYPFMPKVLGVALTSAYLAAATLANLFIAYGAWRRGDVVGLWVMGAFVPLAFAVALGMARRFGLLPPSAATQYALVVAMAIEVPLLLVALSIRSRERHGAQIRELAMASQDALTGLLAPQLFQDRLRQVVLRYKRDREDAAVVFIDLVNYTRIKDHYGSAVAEQSLLRSVIKLRRLLRDVDTVSRVGEARFGLILEGVSSRIAVTDRAARLIAAGLMPLKGLKPEVTLQFHIASVLLCERTMEAPELTDALDLLLSSMSSRTRRPIRFLEPEVTQPAALDAMDSIREADEDSQLPSPHPAAASG